MSELGTLIDSDASEFKESLKDYPVGVIHSIIGILECAYAELEGRKESIMCSSSISLEEKETAVKGIFAEMLKVEEKVKILKDRAKELSLKVFDTSSNQC